MNADSACGECTGLEMRFNSIVSVFGQSEKYFRKQLLICGLLKGNSLNPTAKTGNFVGYKKHKFGFWKFDSSLKQPWDLGEDIQTQLP